MTETDKNKTTNKNKQNETVKPTANKSDKPKEDAELHAVTSIKCSGSNVMTGRYNELSVAAWFSDRPARKGIENGVVYRLLVFKGETPTKDNTILKYDNVWVIEPADDDAWEMVGKIQNRCRKLIAES